VSLVRCKPYHRPLKRSDPGLLRSSGDRKSRCPGWLGDPAIRQRLLDEALPDPDGLTDSFDRPKLLWNAIDGWYFVAVSTNEVEAAYNCYPEVPASSLVEQLAERAARSLADVMEDRA
jgi:hypothetical protein